MVDKELIRTIVGIAGNVISFFLFLSPIPTMMKIIKGKSVQQFKSDPYVATVLNCAMWVFYGLPFITEDNILVITINGSGLLIEFIYVLIFFIYSPGKKRVRIIVEIVISVIFMGAVVFVTFFFFHTMKKKAMFVGILCIIFNVFMYSSPLTVMGLVIKTKSVKYLPLPLSIANFLNGLVWVAYGFLQFDINILVPNGLGALSGLVQLMLYAIYCRTTNWDEDDGPQQPEVELPTRAPSTV